MTFRIKRFNVHFYETLIGIYTCTNMFVLAGITLYMLIPSLFRVLHNRLSSLQKYNTWP